MTRIRYKANAQGVLVSSPMLAVHDMITISLDPSTMTMTVVNSKNETISNGNSKTMAGLKMLAKKTAASLGVVFVDEIRPRKEKNDVTV